MGYYRAKKEDLVDRMRLHIVNPAGLSGNRHSTGKIFKKVEAEFLKEASSLKFLMKEKIRDRFENSDEMLDLSLGNFLADIYRRTVNFETERRKDLDYKPSTPIYEDVYEHLKDNKYAVLKIFQENFEKALKLSEQYSLSEAQTESLLDSALIRVDSINDYLDHFLQKDSPEEMSLHDVKKSSLLKMLLDRRGALKHIENFERADFENPFLNLYNKIKENFVESNKEYFLGFNLNGENDLSSFKNHVARIYLDQATHVKNQGNPLDQTKFIFAQFNRIFAFIKTDKSIPLERKYLRTVVLDYCEHNVLNTDLSKDLEKILKSKAYKMQLKLQNARASYNPATAKYNAASAYAKTLKNLEAQENGKELLDDLAKETAAKALMRFNFGMEELKNNFSSAYWQTIFQTITDKQQKRLEQSIEKEKDYNPELSIVGRQLQKVLEIMKGNVKQAESLNPYILKSKIIEKFKDRLADTYISSKGDFCT